MTNKTQRFVYITTHARYCVAHLFLGVNLKVTVTAWVTFLQIIITTRKRKRNYLSTANILFLKRSKMSTKNYKK